MTSNSKKKSSFIFESSIKNNIDF